MSLWFDSDTECALIFPQEKPSGHLTSDGGTFRFSDGLGEFTFPFLNVRENAPFCLLRKQ